MGRAALCVAVLAISWGSILARLCASPPLTVAFLRLLFASLLVAPFGIAALRSAGPSAPRRALGPVLGGAALAGLCLALHFASWITSLQSTSIAASTLLVSTQPVFSMLISGWTLQERPRPRSFLGVALALLGIGLLARADLAADPGRLGGDLLALLGAAFAAVYLVVGRAVRERVPFPSYLLLVNLGAAGFAGLLALLGRRPLLPVSPRDLAWCVLMAAGPQLLGHGALNWAVRRLRAYVVNLAVLGEPVLASLYGLWIFGEAPPPGLYPGAAMIGLGIALTLREEARRA